MNLSLRQLKVFLGVAESSSFTKTAQRMHLSQAALSAIIREIEIQLRCRLLHRTTRTVSLTEAGMAFLPTATHIVQVLENAALELGSIEREQHRLLRVGVTPHIAVSIVPTVLEQFSQAHPTICVEISDCSPDELFHLVEAGELDAAYGAFSEKASGIDRIPVFPTNLVVISPLSSKLKWPDFADTAGTWKALQDVPLISFPKNNQIQRLIEENLAKERVTTGKRTVVNHLETAIAMAEAGFGVAIVPEVSKAVCQRFRVRADRINPRTEIFIYCITRADRGSMETVQLFSEQFKKTAKEFSPDEAMPTKPVRKRKTTVRP